MGRWRPGRVAAVQRFHWRMTGICAVGEGPRGCTGREDKLDPSSGPGSGLNNTKKSSLAGLGGRPRPPMRATRRGFATTTTTTLDNTTYRGGVPPDKQGEGSTRCSFPHQREAMNLRRRRRRRALDYVTGQ